MTFPQKFCAHHWVEDLPVEERAREVWPNDVTFVDSYKGSPKSKILTSFGLTKEARNDPMFLTKQHFFISVAKQLQPFLEKFQTDAPVPRSTTTLTGLCDDGPLRQPWSDRRTKNCYQHDHHWCACQETTPRGNAVDTGFATKQAMKKAQQQKGISDLMVLKFCMECVQFLVATIAKILERCPPTLPNHKQTEIPWSSSHSCTSK